MVGVAKDGELVVAEIGEFRHKHPERQGGGGAVDDLVGETGLAKPEANRGRVIAPHADNEDGGVLVRRRKGPDPQGDRHLEPEPEWGAAGRGTGTGRAWEGRCEPEEGGKLGGEGEGELPARGRGPRASNAAIGMVLPMRMTKKGLIALISSRIVIAILPA